MGLLLLVRHGQASFGAANYDLLSSTGRHQARRLGAYLAAAGLEPDGIVHGSLRRQAATAEELATSAGWSVPLETDERWDEFDHLAVLAAYGVDPTGMDRRAFQAAFVEATRHWQATSSGWTEFQERTAIALADAAAQATSGRTRIAVTSGGVIAAVATALVGGGPETWQRFNEVIANSSVTRVVVGGGGTRLLTFNEHEHLDRDLVTYR